MVPTSVVLCALLVCFLTFFMARAVGSEVIKKEGCPPGWLYYKKTCYLIRGGHIDWYDADDKCKELGAKLANLRSYQHQSFVHSQLHAKCVDEIQECPKYANQGFCLQHHDLMVEKCRFSCGFCSSICDNDEMYHAMCITYAALGQCSANAYFMMKRCRKSCGCDGFGDHFWIQRRQGLFYPSCYLLHTKSSSVAWADCSTNGAGYICEKKSQMLALSKLDAFHEGCPAHGFGYKDKCYFLNLAPSTWEEAHTSCDSRGGTLASIPYSDVLEFVTAELLVDQSSSWIGLFKDDGQYLWKNGDSVYYLPWNADFDGSQIDSCVQVEVNGNRTVFGPARCKKKQSSVCEIPRTKPTDMPNIPDDDSQGLDIEFSRCSSSWVQHGHFCYKLFREKKTWLEAKEFCQNMTGNLISIHNSSTSLVMNSFGLEEHSAWIGLRKESRGKPYEWSDGSPFDYSYWDSKGARDRLKEQCIHVNTNYKGWSGAPCDLTKVFICQIWRGHPPNITMVDAVTTSTSESPLVTVDVSSGPNPDITQIKTDSSTTAEPSPLTTEAATPISEDNKPGEPITLDTEPEPSIGKRDETSKSPVIVDNNHKKDERLGKKIANSFKGGSETSSWPVSPSQLIGILLGCTFFIFIFSFTFVYISRNSRRKQSLEEAKVERTVSIRYNHKSAGGHGAEFASQVSQSDLSLEAVDPEDMSITFVKGKTEKRNVNAAGVKGRFSDPDIGGSMGFENQLTILAPHENGSL